jgi:site-specific recombinase XerD
LADGAATLKRAGITRRIRPYDLRHAFVTDAVAAGVDIKTVAQIVGDDPRMLFEHYQHVATKQKRAAVEALPEIVFTAQNYGKPKNKEKDMQ